MSFVIIDDYQTANEYLGEIVFAQDTDRKVIGQRMIDEYEKECSRLYNTGMKTFLTDLVMGDHETFYAHAVKWYFPQILRQTYGKYGLGLGIYTMEGFEAINYMAKRVIRNGSNRCGNICAQTMIKITTVYMSFDYSVSEQLEIRKN